MKSPPSFPACLLPFSLSKLGHLCPSLLHCQSTCPPFIKMNISALLVPESHRCTWHRSSLLTSTPSYELRISKLRFGLHVPSFPASLDLSAGLSQHLSTDSVAHLLPAAEKAAKRSVFCSPLLAARHDFVRTAGVFVSTWLIDCSFTELTSMCEKIIETFVHLAFSLWKHTKKVIRIIW